MALVMGWAARWSAAARATPGARLRALDAGRHAGWRPAWRGCWAPGTGAPCPGAEDLLASRASGCGSCGPPGHGAVDAVALAPAPVHRHLGAAGDRDRGAAANLAIRLRPRADAGPARRWRCWPPLRCPRSSAARRRPSTGSRCSSSPPGRSRSGCIYVAMQTGVPAKPGGQHRCAWRRASSRASRRRHWLPVALAGTLAWLWLVRWRTGRHREARVEEPGAAGRRRGPVLAAGDDLAAAAAGLHAQPARWRFPRWRRTSPPAPACSSPGLTAPCGALEHFGRWRVDARTRRAEPGATRLRPPGADRRGRAATAPAGWKLWPMAARPDRPREEWLPSTAHGCAVTVAFSADGFGGRWPRPFRAGAHARPAARAEDRALAGLAAITSISPPWRCTTCLTMDRPSPVPPVSRERLPSTR
jgi:hypothetical protein